MGHVADGAATLLTLTWLDSPHSVIMHISFLALAVTALSLATYIGAIAWLHGLQSLLPTYVTEALQRPLFDLLHEVVQNARRRVLNILRVCALLVLDLSAEDRADLLRTLDSGVQSALFNRPLFHNFSRPLQRVLFGPSVLPPSHRKSAIQGQQLQDREMVAAVELPSHDDALRSVVSPLFRIVMQKTTAVSAEAITLGGLHGANITVNTVRERISGLVSSVSGIAALKHSELSALILGRGVVGFALALGLVFGLGGLVIGSVCGVIIGLMLSLFTFGFSILIAPAIGGGIGLSLGLVIGSLFGGACGLLILLRPGQQIIK